MLARAGLRVEIFDTAGSTVDRIRRGEMSFPESGADELLTQVLASGRLSADPVIGTPIDEFLNLSRSIFERAVDDLAPYFADGALSPSPLSGSQGSRPREAWQPAPDHRRQ